MPENTQFKAPDASKINWLYVGGGIFGLIAVIALMSRKSSTTGTVAAGTSINAALGSIQEQNLNLQGAQSFTQASVSKLQDSQNASFSGINDSLNTGFSTLDTNIQNGNSGITDLINNDVTGINTQLGAILGQEQTTYSYLLNTRQAMEQAFGANSDQVKALDAEIQAVSSEMSRGFSDLGARLTSVPNPVSASTPSGGSSGVVHTFIVKLPGGGEIHTNSTSAAGALNNVPGGHF